MTVEIIDENRIPSIKAVSNSDGTSVLPVTANATVHALRCLKGLTGTDLGGNPDPRDEDRKVAFFAVSATDGQTPVAVYCDETTGALLIQTT